MIKIIITDATELSGTELASLKNFFDSLLQSRLDSLDKVNSESQNKEPDTKLTHISMFTEEELAEMTEERKSKVVLQNPQWQPNPSELFNNEEVIKTDTVEIDSAGQPWDERIHGNSKRKNKDGTWRVRRNSGKEIEETAEVTIKPDLPPPPPPVINTGISFNDLMIKIQKAISANKLTVAQVQQIAERLGIANIAALNKQPFLIVKVDELVTQEINKHG